MCDEGYPRINVRIKTTLTNTTDVPNMKINVQKQSYSISLWK